MSVRRILKLVLTTGQQYAPTITPMREADFQIPMFLNFPIAALP